MLSVLIPTYNRADALEKTLNLLLLQTLASDQYELILIDDGSTDSTPALITRFATLFQKQGIHFTHAHQKNAGAAAARNAALARATGDLLLFMQDDILPPPTFLATHAAFHRAHPHPHTAALGYTPWDTQHQTVTPLMHYLVKSGFQFDFHSLTAEAPTDYRHFYTCNLSLKTSLLGTERFSTAFHGWGFEDTELGYRLAKKGMCLIYHPEAVAYHLHPQTLPQTLSRLEKAGANARMFQTLHPESTLLGSPLRERLKCLASHLLPFTYWGALTAAFCRGMKKTPPPCTPKK